MVDIAAYLARIGYAGPTVATAATLRALHRDHMLAVPFENLDIALGRSIVLQEDLLLRKVVQEHRGGFCYELNGVFAALLCALGFHVTLLSARVARDDGGEGPEFDHLTLRVDLDEPWLADVGFGESFLEPLRLAADIEQADPAGTFRIVAFGDRLRFEKAEPNGQWRPQYSFSLQPRRLEEFTAMCRFHQTSPDSSFTRKGVCSRATPHGRVTLSDMKLIISENGRRQEGLLSSPEERAAILRDKFGIIEPAPGQPRHSEK